MKVGELSSETLYFMINKDAKPSKLEVVADGNGAWVVAKDEEGRILVTTAWSEPKLESDCARLIVRDPDDVMTDYYSGDLPAHPGLFRLQRKRPGRALEDCKVSFSVVPEGGAEALVVEETIKL